MVPVAFKPSWICRTEFERERFLDMHRRLRPVNTWLLVLVLVLVVPTSLGVHDRLAVIPVVFAVVLFAALQRLAQRFTRPELWVYATLLCAELAIAVAVVLDGGQHDGELAMILWPACGVAGRFRSAPAALATAFAAAVISVSELGFDGSVVLHDPLRLTLMLCALLCVTVISTVLRNSDTEHRGAAILDPLTGMLNRSALNHRVAEIEEQSKISGHPVGLIVADLDRFKLVNDSHGHARGDSVLRETAYIMRRELRAYDLAYRIGGEEFAVVLLGADLQATLAHAEQLRAAIAAEPVSGLAITVSLGVTATTAGRPFVWKDAFAEADAALYAAKAAGRDRVRVASPRLSALPAAA